MTTPSRARRSTGAALFTTAVASVGLLTGGVGTASAAIVPAGTCEATALQLTVLGSASVTANHAGSSTAPCKYETGIVDLGALNILSAQLVEATTAVTPRQTATAQSTVAHLDVGIGGLTGSLTGSLLGGTGPNSLGGSLTNVVQPLVGPGGVVTNLLAPLQGLGLTVVGVDPSAMLAEAGTNLPAALSSALPDVLDAGLISARATATCQNGAATLSGSTSLTGLSVLGTPIDANDPLEKVISLDTANLSEADLVSVNAILKSIKVKAAPLSLLGLVVGSGEQSLYSLLTTPSGGLLSAVNDLLPVGTTLDSVLGGLSSTLQPVIQNTRVSLPTGLLRAVVTPRSETNEGGVLTETALSLSVTALSQPVLSGVVARARVSASSLDCAGDPPPPNPPKPDPDPPVVKEGVPLNDAIDKERFSSGLAEDALKCEDVRLRLLDVRPSGAKTYVQGVAERRYVGSTATIYLAAGRKKVGTTTVRLDGTFATKVALAPKAIRRTSKARYYAIISGDRTRALKLNRRMSVTTLKKVGNRVTFAGRTTLPRSTVQRSIQVQQRISCSTFKTVATVKPNKAGRFVASFVAPTGSRSGVYRAYTKVPTTAPSRKLKPTYTLPSLLDLR